MESHEKETDFDLTILPELPDGAAATGASSEFQKAYPQLSATDRQLVESFEGSVYVTMTYTGEVKSESSHSGRTSIIERMRALGVRIEDDVFFLYMKLVHRAL